MTTHQPSLSSRRISSGRSRAHRGFTILEILIVIALIAALAGASIVALNKLFGGGQEEVARIFVTQSIDPALMAYRINMGRYPTTEQGLAALRTAPAGAGDRWKGPYLEADPVDPWGNPYQYRYPGTRGSSKGYDVWSFGPDGVESADDIGNWR